MSEAATIYDVAELAGVSISTVSLVLNQPTRVRDSTRRRVLDAANHLAFRPKSEAVSRARSGFGRIGVLSPFTSYASFHRRLDGILARLSEVGNGLEVVLFDHESVDGTASAFADSLPLTERLDGLILMGVPLSRPNVELVGARRFPVVLVDVGEPRFSLPSVIVDDYLGGHLAAAHLLETGAATYLYVGIPQRSTDYVFQSQRRQAGFLDALAAAGVPPAQVTTRVVGHSIAEALAAITPVLDGLPGPVAVFCFSDELAAGTVQAARRLGRRVGEEVTVVGFDNSDLAEGLDMTSVHQPLRESGALAVDLLLAQLRAPAEFPASAEPAVLGLELVVRGTTARRPTIHQQGAAES